MVKLLKCSRFVFLPRMRIVLIIVFTLFGKNLIAQKPMLVSSSKHADFTNRNIVTTLNGRPISFYLNHLQIDSYSKMFFKGKLSISSNSITNGIIDSVLTKNPETRPFYFFLFNQIVDLSDETMVDLVANRCVDFVEKYPCDFFNSFNQPDININVVKWTTYMGQALKDRNKYVDFKNVVDCNLKGCCFGVQDLWKSFFVEVRMCLVQ